MRLILKGRGKGKTTELLYTSDATRYRIIVPTSHNKEYLWKMAKELDLKIPEPMTCTEYLLRKRGLHEEGILIDDLEFSLEDILTAFFGVPVKCATMNISERK